MMMEQGLSCGTTEKEIWLINTSNFIYWSFLLQRRQSFTFQLT